MSKGVVGRELLDDSVVAMEAVVASSNEGGVHGRSLPGKNGKNLSFNNNHGLDLCILRHSKHLTLIFDKSG